MSLDITIKERKEFRCPDCGRLVTTRDIYGLSELTVGLRDFERIANLQLKLWDGGKVRVGAYSFSKLWKR